MSNVSQMPSTAERKERRRLHLREVTEPAPSGETVGAVLRAARLERGAEAATVATALKMRRDQLEALETDNIAKLPGRTYAVGFVRAYAKYLRLDDEAIVQRFKDELASQDAAQPVQLVFPEAQEERRLPNGSIVILALLIAMVIYGISYLTIPNRGTATTAKAEEPPVVVVEQPKVEAPKPAPAPVKDATAPVVTQAEAQAEPASFVAGANPLHEQPVPTDAAPQVPSFTIAQVQPVADAAVAPQPAPAQSSAPNSAARITLKALEPSYVKVRDPSKPRGSIIARVLEAGESYQGPDQAGLVLQTGNAGGLQVAVDGRVLGVLGKRGEVIPRVPLDPSYFLERMAAAQ